MLGSAQSIAGDLAESALEDGPLVSPETSAPRQGSPLSWCYRAIVVGLAVSDAACALAGFLVADLVLAGWANPGRELLRVGLAIPVAWVVAFQAFGLYNVRQISALEEFRRLIGASCVATSLVSIVRAWSNVPPYRKSLLVTWLVALTFDLVARRLWRWHRRRLRQSGHLAARTVILGTNDEAGRLAHALRQPDLGFRVLGHVTTGHEGSSDRVLPVVGHITDLERTVRDLGVECVFVASTAASAEDMARMGEVCREADIEMRVSANLADILISRLTVQSFGDVLALSVKPARISTAQAAVKRAFDVLVASVALIVSLPLMAVVALAVRLSSRGPILFRQDRVTKGGRRFRLYKFRTMVENDEVVLDGEVGDLTVPFFKARDDPRVTRVGRFLRRYSLDELPQLWLVIKGDLSLVGPRPLPLIQVEHHPHLLRSRHQVRAGVTGWWQINGRSSLDPHRALRMDLFYIENWSLSLDLFILFRTAGTVLSRRGAY